MSKPELEKVKALLQMAHTIPVDCLAAEQIVRLRSMTKRIDRALTDGKVEPRPGRRAG